MEHQTGAVQFGEFVLRDEEFTKMRHTVLGKNGIRFDLNRVVPEIQILYEGVAKSDTRPRSSIGCLQGRSYTCATRCFKSAMA